MFDFDKFINQPCIELFGKVITYIPANSNFDPFEIKGNFQEDYQDVKNDISTLDVNSNKIVLFIRNIHMPKNYPKALQGDFIKTLDSRYQIIDIQAHIVGSKKLILHESPEKNN